MLVPNIIELPIPWNILNIIRTSIEFTIPQRIEEIIKVKIPIKNNFFLPFMSAIFLKGIKETAVVL